MLRSLTSRTRSFAGFTLIELLIVILIIGILIAIGVPAYLKYTASANDRDAQAALMTAYKAAVAGDSEVNTGKFPAAATVVADIQADEPSLQVTAGDCVSGVATAAVKQVLVDPASTSSSLTLCTRSASGAIWKLSGPLTGTPAVSDASTVTLTFSGREITDASRSAATGWPTTQLGGSTDDLPTGSGTAVWEAATNLFQYGQDDSTTNWLPNGTGTETRSIDPSGPGPFSPQSIKVVTGGVAPGEGADPTTASTLSAAPGTSGAGSIEFKGTAGQQYLTYLFWANTDATYTSGSGTVFTATGSWQRLTPAPVTETAGKTGQALRLRVATSGAARADTFWLANAMLESGANVVSPYIATSGGSSASRLAPLIRVPTNVVSGSEGWFATRIRMGWASTTPANDPMGGTGWETIANLSDAGSDFLRLMYREQSSDWRFRVSDGSSSWDAAVPATFSSGAYQTVIGKWATVGGVLNVWVSANGSAFNLNNTATLAPFTPSSFYIGAIGNGSLALDGNFVWFACGTGTLSDADATTITGWGNAVPSKQSFPSAAQETMVWNGNLSTGSLK